MSQPTLATSGVNGTPTKQEKPKSEKQLKYEAKIAKQQQQQQKQANGVAPNAGKPKEKKKPEGSSQPSAPYVEETPKGQKKSEQ